MPRPRETPSSSSSAGWQPSLRRRTRTSKLAKSNRSVRRHAVRSPGECRLGGQQHRIFEALPHLHPVASVRMLRAVLARLDVSLVPIDRHAADLTAEDLPCLLVENEDNCHLVTPGTRGEFEIYGLSGDRSNTDRCRSGRHGLSDQAQQDRRPRSPEHHLVDLSATCSSSCEGRFPALPAIRSRSTLWALLLSLYVLLVYDIVIATSSLDTLAFLASGALVALGFELWLRQRAIQSYRLSCRPLRCCRFGPGACVRAQSAPCHDRACTDRLAIVALPSIRDRARAVCGQLRFGAIRSAIHAVVCHLAVHDWRVAGVCAGRTFHRHGHCLRSGCDRQHCADRTR